MDQIIESVLNNISSSKNLKNKVLNRDFFNQMVEEYYTSLDDSTSAFFHDIVSISDYNFTGADFRNISRKDLEIFDFSHCNISRVRLDRNGIEYFKPYIINSTITADELILEGANLGPKLFVRYRLGIACISSLNLSNMNLFRYNFRYCNLQSTIFENSNIDQADFRGAINMAPDQFAYSTNFATALFFNEAEKDQKFKNKIANLAEKYQNIPKKSKDMNPKFFDF